MAETVLNANSSRSHSVFNIRLVMAPYAERTDYRESLSVDTDENKVYKLILKFILYYRWL